MTLDYSIPAALKSEQSRYMQKVLLIVFISLIFSFYGTALLLSVAPYDG